MNYLKSAFVLAGFIAVTVPFIVLIFRCKELFRNKSLKKAQVLAVLAYGVALVVCVQVFGDYVYPFRRTLSPVLIAEFDVPEEFELEYPGQRFWHGAYEQYGLFAESFYFDPDNKNSGYGFGWPPMDFEHFNYIITYGQKIETLTYNVWETIDEPIRTGAKAGHMQLCEEFAPEKVYIYQIPKKVRIENDINDMRDREHRGRFVEKDRGRFA